MFTSNQKFRITGDNLKNLEEALKCILYFNNSKIEGYSFDEDGMILHQWKSKKIEMTEIPIEEIGNYEYLFLLIQQYLVSTKYNNLLKLTKNIYENADGGCRRGWEIGAYKEELNKYDDWSKCIYIKPFWTYYSK